MKYLSTNYWTFINEAATTAPKKSNIDYDRINALKDQLKTLEGRLRLEKDENKLKKIQSRHVTILKKALDHKNNQRFDYKEFKNKAKSKKTV